MWRPPAWAHRAYHGSAESGVQAGQMAEAAGRYDRLARDTQRYRSRAGVARFFDALDRAGPGLVPVQEWRPRSGSEARQRRPCWGGVGRRR
jgi:hypothetical protein